MAFSFWNLLVVLCFVILYLGVALVFTQLRRLRDELHHLSAANSQSEKSADDSRSCAEIILRRLTSFETNMTSNLEEIPAQLKADLEAIQGELRFIAQTPAVGMSSPPIEMQSSPRTGGGGSGKESDAYREARLLLANDVDEERVVNETGLTVEEVSLLKRMIPKNGQVEE